jgi:hypothetical protein
MAIGFRDAAKSATISAAIGMMAEEVRWVAWQGRRIANQGHRIQSLEIQKKFRTVVEGAEHFQAWLGSIRFNDG